ncbi:hypothetical protein [Gorillibacterium massiliense]|uniref:hypothetical protein n=1 Tax=Gorillibacterium massiliense TaxID=1280390 RepID=UPI001EE182AE|nr:hypothetical protein [Gorillibacterium massiliense]
MGDSIFESERLAPAGGYLPVRANSGNEDLDSGFLKPDKDEFKWLSKGLKFLKYSEAEAEEMYNLIGGAIKLASSIVSIIGAVSTVADLAQKLGLFGPAEKSTDERLKEIGARIEQIYGYLSNENRRGLYNEALGWRVATDMAHAKAWNVRVSRSPENLRELNERANELDRSILLMLDPGKANIAFLKSVYGYAPNTRHWIDAAGTSCLVRADGAPLPAYGSQELSSDIWDAGHYNDVLLSALKERLIIATAMEPAYRSTGYDRAVLADIAEKLRLFIAKWRSSILVAVPSAGITGGGELYNPFDDPDYAANGILIGAVDPVTGISSLEIFSGFQIEYSRTSMPWSAWGGVWDTSKAVDPEKALKAATDAHTALVDSVIRASGIAQLTDLQKQFRSAASLPSKSQFVDLPDARFRYALILPYMVRGGGGTEETIDLGSLKTFSGNPNKTYPATRYHRLMEKTFRFRMARRAEWSRVQLGYRLRIAGLDIELCPFSTRPAEGFPSTPFPTGPIENVHQFATDVFDCCQTRPFSASDEDRFEREGEDGERVFHNLRKGSAKIQITVQFEPLYQGASEAHAGEAIVKIRNLEPEAFPDSFIIEAVVFETIVDSNGQPDMFPADSITIHMTPSYLIVGQDFMNDRQKAIEHMIRTVKGINDKFSMEQLTPESFKPSPDPAWKTLRRAQIIENKAALVQAALAVKPDLVKEEINYYLPPQLR